MKVHAAKCARLQVGVPNGSTDTANVAYYSETCFYSEPFRRLGHPIRSWPKWTFDMSMEPVLHSFAYCLDFLREQVADVGPADMVAQPNGIMNHPAWVIGHLTFSCQALGGEIGLRDWLPTVRHAITQVLIAHTANHIGQLTIWRQAMGLPRLGRSFA